MARSVASLPLYRPAGWLLVYLCALLLGGCSGNCSRSRGPLLPERVSWPAIAAYPGAEVLRPRLAAPRRQTYWSFKTTASIAQVDARYRALLEPQGWRSETNGTLTDFQSCPKLTLDVRESVLSTGEPFYEAALIETPCPPAYC